MVWIQAVNALFVPVFNKQPLFRARGTGFEESFLFLLLFRHLLKQKTVKIEEI